VRRIERPSAFGLAGRRTRGRLRSTIERSRRDSHREVHELRIVSRTARNPCGSPQLTARKPKTRGSFHLLANFASTPQGAPSHARKQLTSTKGLGCRQAVNLVLMLHRLDKGEAMVIPGSGPATSPPIAETTACGDMGVRAFVGLRRRGWGFVTIPDGRQAAQVGGAAPVGACPSRAGSLEVLRPLPWHRNLLSSGRFFSSGGLQRLLPMQSEGCHDEGAHARVPCLAGACPCCRHSRALAREEFGSNSGWPWRRGGPSAELGSFPGSQWQTIHHGRGSVMP